MPKPANLRSPLTAASIPDPTPVLFLAVLTVVLIWSTETNGATAMLVTAAMVVPVAVYLLSKSAMASIITLVVAAAMPRLYVEIGGLKARPEHMVAGLLLVALLFALKKRQEPVRWIVADYFLLAYIVMNLVSSLFFSVAPMQTIKWAMQQVLVILPYFFLRLLIVGADAFRRAFQMVLLVGALEAAYALICFYSHLLLGTSFGMTVDQYDAAPGTYGTQFEANILGAYCGANAIMMLAMYLKQPCRKYLLGFAVTAAAMAISLSRAVLMATAFVFVVLLVYGLWTRLMTRRALTSIAATVLGVALFLAPVLVPIYIDRFNTLEVADITTDDTARARLLPIAISWDDVLLHPIAGNGTSSFQLMFDYSVVDPSVEAGWIGNTEMRVLHDTGALGLGSFLLFLLALFFGGRKILKRKSNPELTALLFAGLIYGISYQATEGTLLAFTWVHLGLIGCALAVFKWSNQPAEQNAGEITAA